MNAHVPELINKAAAIDGLMSAMREQGIETQDSLRLDGTLERFHVEGDRKGSKNGWLCVHLDAKPAGQFGCNRRYAGHKFSWRAEKSLTKALTAAELQAMRDRAEEQRQERAEQTRQRQQVAAERAKAAWDAAVPAPADHPYLARKVIGAHGVRLGVWEVVNPDTGEVRVISDKALLVPFMDRQRNVRNLQAILPGKLMSAGSRDKDFLKDGEKLGLFFPIGTPKQHDGRNVFVICEGFATGASIHHATGHMVLVAFDTSNLLAVADSIRERQADAIIVIGADNDQWTFEPIANPGLHYARKAAKAVGGLVALPPFAADDEARPTDFNDLQLLDGIAAVAGVFESVLAQSPDSIEEKAEAWESAELPAHMTEELPAAVAEQAVQNLDEVACAAERQVPAAVRMSCDEILDAISDAGTEEQIRAVATLIQSQRLSVADMAIVVERYRDAFKLITSVSLTKTEARKALAPAKRAAAASSSDEFDDFEPGESFDEDGIDRPCFVCYETKTNFGKPGLYYHGKKQKGEEEVVFDQFVCTPIWAEAATSSEREDSFGLVLRFLNSSGSMREWAMPMSMLKGSGEELRGELLSMGVRIDVNSHRLLMQWLMGRNPEKKLTAADTIGWHGEGASRAFVLPRRTLGNQNVVFQSEHIAHDEFATRGTLQGWQKEVGALCSGNSWLVLAVSAALAGPVLKLASKPGVGIHFVGDSSLGKSTLLNAAASVWGGSSFMRTWRATGNGLEGIAAALNDTALLLDEIGEAPAAEVGSIVYAIGNGTGKSRAARTGAAKKAARWRLALISSGEKTLSTIMAEAGKASQAGQDVRMLDIPAKRTHGALDKLYHFTGGAEMSAHLQAAAKEEHFGHLGPAFVERLMADTRDFKAMLARFVGVAQFKHEYELEGRAAQALALIALAGELATEYGLTTWKEGEALQAAIEAFDAWREFRGEGQTEVRKILRAAETFIDRHGDSRFSSVDASDSHMVRDRAGWWKDDADGRIYLFTSSGLQEALKGFELARGISALKDAGWIAVSDKDKSSKQIRIHGEKKRLYWLRQPDQEEVVPVDPAALLAKGDDDHPF